MMITTPKLVNAMVQGTEIHIPLSDGYASIKGTVQGMVREDGSGQSWVVYLAVPSLYDGQPNRVMMVYVRTGSYYRATLLGKAKQLP